MKPATLYQALQVLKIVKDQGLGSLHVQALFETELLADLCEGAKQRPLAHADRARFRSCLGLDFRNCLRLGRDWQDYRPTTLGRVPTNLRKDCPLLPVSFWPGPLLVAENV